MTRKNILLISLDDAVSYWNYKTIFGQEMQTPNLDRICEQSTAFRNAYCQVPVCSPSRASFMTGISPHHSGVTKQDSLWLDTFGPENLWPFTLKSNGYYSSTGGKVIRGYRALDPDVHDVVHSDPREIYHAARRAHIFEGGVVPDQTGYGGFRGGMATVTEEADRDIYCNKVAENAMRFLDDYNGDAPFYRGVGFQSPHGPWVTPQSYKEMYLPWKFQRPPEWEEGFDEIPAVGEIAPKNFADQKLRFWRLSVRNYFSSMSYVDYQIGRVWDALKASRHAENTVVILLSDHGLHLGEHDRFRKGTLWEQVCGVPLIIHDPSVPVGREVTTPVGLTDVANTVMDYSDLPPIGNSVGLSLRPAVMGDTPPERAIPTFYTENASIRMGRYRFGRYADGTTELFDLDEDWWQQRNLGPNHPAYADMSRAHAACCAEYGYSYDSATTGS